MFDISEKNLLAPSALKALLSQMYPPTRPGLRSEIFNRCFLPGHFLSTPSVLTQQTDFITPQAFGRKTFSDEEVGERVGRLYRLHDEDIPTFKWLEEFAKFDPGHPNLLFAERCIELATECSGTCALEGTSDTIRPVIGQWEVLYAMYKLSPRWYEIHKNALVAIWPPQKGYLDTQSMLLHVQKIAMERGLTKPLLIAHPEHIQRCFFLAQKIFGKSVGRDGTSEISDEWFDPQSVQKWTRGPKRWFLYEMLARLHHRYHGWM